MNYLLTYMLDSREVSWRVGAGTTRVGRDPGSDVWLQDESVSRKHAEILVDGDGASIRDLGSRNGTTVNGSALEGNAPPFPLEIGDRVGFGALSLLVCADDSPSGAVGIPGEPSRAAGEPKMPQSGRVGVGASAAHPDAGSDPAVRGGDSGSASSSLPPARSGSSWIQSGAQATPSTRGGAPTPLSFGDDLTATRMSWRDIREEIGTRSTQLQQLFHVLMEAGQLLVLPQSLQELFENSVELVSRLVPAERILLLLRNQEGELIVSAARGVDSEADPRTFLSQSILRAVLDDHQALLLRDPRSDPRFLGSESIIALRLRSTMTVPLFDNEDVIGLIHVDTSNPFQSYDQDQLRTLALFGNLLAVKIKNARLLDELRVKARLEHEMETAAQIQRRLLPDKLIEIENYRIAARLLPCLETAGDFFDVARRADQNVEIMIGDVAGKGVGAALLMSHTVSAYRVLSEEGHGLPKLMERLCGHVFASSDATRFVTLFASRLDPRSHRLTYVNGGHSPVLVLRADETWMRLSATGAAVGLIEGGTFVEESIQLEPGTMLCLYTDGIIEATGDDLYGEERLVKVLQRCRGMTPDEVITAVLEDVREFTGDAEQDDDITLVVLQRIS